MPKPDSTSSATFDSKNTVTDDTFRNKPHWLVSALLIGDCTAYFTLSNSTTVIDHKQPCEEAKRILASLADEYDVSLTLFRKIKLFPDYVEPPSFRGSKLRTHEAVEVIKEAQWRYANTP